MTGCRPWSLALPPLLLLTVAATSCRAPGPPPNVILVSIDTLRADRLGCYGASGAETPAIDGLARQGVLFRHAYASLPLTLPSHATMLTGLEPVAHGLVDNGMSTANLGAPTLGERLSQAGYDTGAFVAAFVLNRIFGLDRGFSNYDDGPPEETELSGLFTRVADARERVDQALAWLGRTRSSPFFLWLHLYDVHAPHEPPPAFRQRFAANPYDGEVAYVDSQVSRLLSFLKSRGLERNTLLVLTSDHGESLGEHSEETHGLFVYDATLRVPLIMRLPGRLPAGRVIDSPAALADLSPTILDLLHLPQNPTHQGRALFGRKARGERTLWAQSDYPERQYGWARLRSVRRGRWKYIEAPRPELYDLQADPGEQREVGSAFPTEARTLQALVRRQEDDLRKARPLVPAQEPDPETRGRLAALGYVSAPAPRSTGLDPKDGISRLASVERAMAALLQGGPALREGEGLLRQAALDFPQHGHIQVSLGRTLEQLGRLGDAEAAYRQAAQHEEARAQALGRLVALAARQGDAAKEVTAAQQLTESFPRHAASRRLLADALNRAGRFAEAEAAYRQSLERDPQARSARVAWCRFLLARARVDEARSTVTVLVAEDPDDPESLALSGLLAQAEGRLADALRSFDAAIAGRPDGSRFLVDRGLARLEAEDLAGARKDLQRARALSPSDVQARRSLERLLAARRR
ncbi:MAG TPA: sulfatase-like hydrolase/transferase [Vicinamibacteria bacterium]|nr:sulfatase-like hydrolase/transferase [Vicinamibacteria bacterium]